MNLPCVQRACGAKREATEMGSSRGRKGGEKPESAEECKQDAEKRRLGTRRRPPRLHPLAQQVRFRP